MSKTLGERLKLAMAGPPKVSGVMLAVACRVKPPSVSAWRTGDSKSLEGSNLLKAAKCLNVRPEWLADGVGPMRPSNFLTQSAPALHEPSDMNWSWPFKNIKPKQWSLLDEDQKEDVEKYVMLQVKSREPPEKRASPEINAATAKSA